MKKFYTKERQLIIKIMGYGTNRISWVGLYDRMLSDILPYPYDKLFKSDYQTIDRAIKATILLEAVREYAHECREHGIECWSDYSQIKMQLHLRDAVTRLFDMGYLRSFTVNELRDYVDDKRLKEGAGKEGAGYLCIDE